MSAELFSNLILMTIMVSAFGLAFVLITGSDDGIDPLRGEDDFWLNDGSEEREEEADGSGH